MGFFRKRKKLLALLFVVLVMVVVVNIIAYNHVYKFTHFSGAGGVRTQKPDELSFSEKFVVLFTGVTIPKPVNEKTPPYPYKRVHFSGTVQLEGWLSEGGGDSGVTVILFHGYAGKKSDLIEESVAFREFGFRTLLVDFPGSGGSGGNRTTMGYAEARDVAAAVEFVKKRNEGERIVLFGVSMGAVAILRAVGEYGLKAEALILESPFGSMVDAIRNRFKMMGVPSFPFAELLMFWGSVQQGHWMYSHRCTGYAEKIEVPVLMMYGLKDEKVTEGEIAAIYGALKGIKRRKNFARLKHESYIEKRPGEWRVEVRGFLKGIGVKPVVEPVTDR